MEATTVFEVVPAHANGNESEAVTSLGSDDSQGDGKRERSTIEFPYSDLNDAVSIARAIHNDFGQSCMPDQLSAALGHNTMAGGAFRLKISTARIFGVIETTREHYSLTPLGRDIVNPSLEPQARVAAFLNVPLYKALFDQYRGHLLPRSVGLENEMVRLGVSQKQKEKARQVFLRSAEQAGLFAHGRDKLVMPSINGGRDFTATTPPPPPSEVRPKLFGAAGAGGTGGAGTTGGSTPGVLDLHPFIQGLLVTLPPTGEYWPVEKQEQWLAVAKQVFGLLYSSDPKE